MYVHLCSYLYMYIHTCIHIRVYIYIFENAGAPEQNLEAGASELYPESVVVDMAGQQGSLGRRSERALDEQDNSIGREIAGCFIPS